MLTLKGAGWETILPGEENSIPSRFTGGKDNTNPPHFTGMKDNTVPPRFAGEESKGGAQTKRFHLIFDDGYEGVYHHAFPILEEIGFKATVFIPSRYIGKNNDWDHQLFGRPFRHLSSKMLCDLVEAGWMIGSHGISHIDLISLDDKQLRAELFVSREILSETIESEVEWISFPFGRYGTREIDSAIEAGYRGTIVPALRKSAKTSNGLQIIIADAVYCWDPTAIILGRLERRKGYGAGRLFRTVTNRCSYGTVMWKRLFTRNNQSEPLATDE